MILLLIKHEFILKHNDFVEIIKITSYPFSSFIRRSYSDTKKSIDGGIFDKTEDHIERNHQISKHFEQRYKCVTDFT